MRYVATMPDRQSFRACLERGKIGRVVLSRFSCLTSGRGGVIGSHRLHVLDPKAHATLIRARLFVVNLACGTLQPHRRPLTTRRGGLPAAGWIDDGTASGRVTHSTLR